jgi:hypothetical protein
MPRAYIPLKLLYNPPAISLPNGIAIVTREQFKPAELAGWGQVFNHQQLKELHEWNLALAYKWESDASLAYSSFPEVLLADAQLAMQVAAPIGNYLSVCLRGTR